MAIPVTGRRVVEPVLTGAPTGAAAVVPGAVGGAAGRPVPGALVVGAAVVGTGMAVVRLTGGVIRLVGLVYVGGGAPGVVHVGWGMAGCWLGIDHWCGSLRPNVTPGVVGHAGSVPYPVGTAACAGTVTAMANRARTAPVHSPAILHERVMRRASRRVRRGATRVSGL